MIAESVKGLEVKKTPQGLTVARLHYSADPAKDPDTIAGAFWRENALLGYIGGLSSLGWRREMEIDWGAGIGELLFPGFIAREGDLLCDPFPLPDTAAFYAGLDWGNRNVVAFHVYAVLPENEIVVCWEYYRPGKDVNVYTVTKEISETCPYFSKLIWTAADPSMWKEDQQRESTVDKTSIAAMLSQEVKPEHRFITLMPAHGRSDVAAIERTKVLLFQGPTKVKILKTCPNWIIEFRNLRYPQANSLSNGTEKILDKDNHAWDDWKYFLLSHPIGKIHEEKPVFGTIGYLNAISAKTADIAASTGESSTSIFNDMYGRGL